MRKHFDRIVMRKNFELRKKNYMRSSSTATRSSPTAGTAAQARPALAGPTRGRHRASTGGEIEDLAQRVRTVVIVVFLSSKKFLITNLSKIFLMEGFIPQKLGFFSSPPFGRRFFLVFPYILHLQKFPQNLKNFPQND